MSPSDRAVFVAVIHADPDDLTARLVYADWLDEQGDPDGELVRLLCEERLNGYGKGSAWKRLEQLCGGLEGIAVRLDERQRRHLALDFAEHVLPHFSAQYPKDRRPEYALKTYREYVRGPRPKVDYLRDRLEQHIGSISEAMQAVMMFCSLDGRTGTPSGAAASYAARAMSGATAREIRTDWNRTAVVASLAEWAAFDAAAAQGRSGDVARDAEKSWQLCRAVEYRLGFVPPQAIAAPE